MSPTFDPHAGEKIRRQKRHDDMVKLLAGTIPWIGEDVSLVVALAANVLDALEAYEQCADFGGMSFAPCSAERSALWIPREGGGE